MASLVRIPRGFGLVELMIALALSLVLIAGLYAALLGDKRSYQNTKANQALVDKKRMGLQSLKFYLQQAGFRDFAQLKSSTYLPATASDQLGFSWAEAQLVQARNNLGSGLDAKPGTDDIQVRFYGAEAGSDNLLLCNGSALAHGDWATLHIFVRSDDALVCRDRDGDTVLDQNVENLQLQFGTRQGQNNHYHRADQISDWEQINRVRIALLLSEEFNASGIVNQNSYQVLDELIPPGNDRKLRQVASKTIMLPNVGV